MESKAIKGLSPDGSFRAVVVEATAAVQEAVDIQFGQLENNPGVDAVSELLCELLVATILVRVEMAPKQRLQMTLRNAEGSVFADSHPDGKIRGVVSGRCPRPGDDARLYVARVLEDGQLHQGLVESYESGISETLTQYMLQSEQVVSVTGVRARVENGRVKYARGFLVQMLPDAPPDVAERVIEGIDALQAEWEIQDPDLLLLDILGGVARVTATSPVYYGCTCSEDTVLMALKSLGPDDIQEMKDAGEVLEIDCHYCGKKYAIDPERI